MGDAGAGTLAVGRGGTGATTSTGTGSVVLSAGPTMTGTTAIDTLNLTNALDLAYGGTGQTSAQSSINTLAGAVTSGSYLRGNGTNVVMSTIQVGDVPTLNQNTTGSAGSLNTNFTSGYILYGQGTGVPGAAAAVTWDGVILQTVNFSATGAILGPISGSNSINCSTLRSSGFIGTILVPLAAARSTCGLRVYSDGNFNIEMMQRTSGVFGLNFITRINDGVFSWRKTNGASDWGTELMYLDNSGVLTVGTLTPTNALGVAYGGSGTTTATGTAGSIVLSVGPTLTGTTTISTLNLTNALGTLYGGTGADGSAILANKVLASPNGSTGGVSYRSLVAADLPTVTFSPGSAGTYGSTTSIPTIVVDTYGRITGISTSSITTLSGLTTNGVLYGTSSTTATTTGTGSSGQPLLSAGVGSPPAYGTLGIAYGGTGQTTASTGFNALSPMTTLGDIIYGAASGSGTRLAGNTTGTKNFLVQTGTGTVSAAPTWGTLAATDLPVVTFSPGSAGTYGSATSAPTIVVDMYGRITGISTSTTSSLSGLTTYGVLYGSSATTAASTAVGTSGQPLLSGGTGAAPSYGTLAVAYGGTGQTTSTAGFNALSPMTTLGDLIYGAASGSGTRLAGSVSATAAFLSQTGSGTVSAAPSWVLSTGTGSVVLSAGPTLTGTTTIGTLNVNGTATIASSTLTLPTVLATTSVGVGTNASPPNKLSVSSTTAQLPSSVQISHTTGDWGLVIKRTANDTGSSNFAFLKSRGETSVIIAQGDSIGRISWHAVTNVTGPVVQHLAEINVTNTTFTGGNADGTMIFLTKQTTDSVPVERMRILPSGFVGIGTNNPGTALQVNGTVTATTFSGSAASLTSFPTLNQNTTGSSGSCTGNSATATTAAACSGNSSTATTATNQSGGTVSATTVSATTSYTRTPASTTAAFQAAGASLVNTSYNLILTAANDTLNRLVLFVNGSTRTADGGASNVVMRNDGGSLILGNTSYPTILYGNVGIGTVSAPNVLDIRGGNIGLGSHLTDNGVRFVGIYDANNPTTSCLGGMEIQNTTLGGSWSQKVHFKTHYYGVSASRRMTINESGSVGIGTESPAKPLHVWGGMLIGASSDSRATTVTLNAPGATVTFSPNNDIGDGARIMCLQCPDLSSTTANLVSFSLQVAPTGSFGTQRTSLDLKGFRVASASYGGFCITSPFDVGGSYDLLYTDRTKAYFQQNLGIGTNSPQFRLNSAQDISLTTDIAPNTAQFAVMGVTDNTKRMVFGYDTQSAGNGYGFIKAGKYNTAWSNIALQPTGGNVGIGITNPTFKLHVTDGNASFANFGPNTTWGANLKIGAGSTYASSGTASIVVTDGNLHMDAATNGKTIYLNYFQGGGSGGVNTTVGCYAAFTATGDITAFSSDERLKTKVGFIENALEKVCSLTAFKYTHNETARQNGFTDDNIYVGLSAQEVQKVLPEVVKPAPFDQGTDYDVGKGKSKSGENYLTVQYERIVSLLVEAIKEERAERLKVEERLWLLEKLLLKE